MNKQFDEYIAKAKPFAQPILVKIREVVHAVLPDVVEEIKWGTPYFILDGMLCGIGSFSKHVSLSFWRGKEMEQWSEVLKGVGNTSMASISFYSVEDLPSKSEFTKMLKFAAKLNKSGKKSPGNAKKRKKPVRVPQDFREMIDASPVAKRVFDAFPPSHKREYVEWVEEAKRKETRQRRMQQGIEWMEEGKNRNWKYESKK